MSSDWLLAIDFGTSSTAAAHTLAIGGQVAALQLTHNRLTMSSSVFVESDGTLIVGEAALARATSNPTGFVPSPKRVMGLAEVSADGVSIPTWKLVSAVIGSVLARAKAAHAGTSPGRLILTHPEAWSPSKVQVLGDAAVACGIPRDRVTTISEPRAAAQYYSSSDHLSPGQSVGVFDFGGGTLDVAVLKVNAHNGFEVVGANGDNSLGGRSFDSALRRWVDEQLEIRNSALCDHIRSADNFDDRYALEKSVREAKELLSESPSANITATGPNGMRETFHITRTEFEELVAPLLDHAVTLTAHVLAQVDGLNSGKLRALYLTGGSSRVPCVHDALGQIAHIATLDDPKLVVAQGALMAAIRQTTQQSYPPASASRAPAPPAPTPPAPTSVPAHPVSPQLQPSPQVHMHLPGHTGRQLAPHTFSGQPHPTSSNTPLIAGLAVVALIVMVILVATWSGAFESTTDPLSASQYSPLGAGSGTGTGEVADRHLALLPTQLVSGIDTSTCQEKLTPDGLDRLACEFRKNSSLKPTGLYPNIGITIDKNQAGLDVKLFRDNRDTQIRTSNTGGPPSPDFFYTASGSYAVCIVRSGDNRYTLLYRDRDTGIMFDIVSFFSMDEAKYFLTQTGLD